MKPGDVDDKVPVSWFPSQIFQIEQQIHLVLRPEGAELTSAHAWAKGMGSKERKILPWQNLQSAAYSHPSF